jgi:hypothetical protein
MDGIPNILAEAMALGRPVVSTRLSGVPELVEDGVSGLLAEPGDPGSLADHLERLIRDRALAERLGAAGRRQIAAMFDLRTNVADLAFRLTTEAAGGHEVGSPPARTRVAVLRSAAPIAGGGVDRARTAAGGSAEGRRCVTRP